MKKITAILLLFILLFYVAGYRLLFSIIENKATVKLEQQINNGNYREEELVEIRIPLSMPYYSDKDFESVYGETDWNGQHYRYVKRKISGNILYLLCIPNSEKNHIVSAKNDFTKALSDIQQHNTPSKQSSSLFKHLLSDYISRENKIQFSLLINQPFKYHSFSSDVFSQFEPQTPSQPPEFV